MLSITGELMSEDKVIATVKNGEITDCNETLLPLYLKRTKNLEGWLASRAIDTHRTNSRLLKKALRLRTADDAQIALAVNAATVTDRYWFRPEESTASYEDIRFKENYFDSLALRGSYEKCWRLIDGAWWMYKSGTPNEYFSELFISRLGEKLGFDMVHYELDDGYIRSKNFTDGTSYNFEPMSSLVGENDDYSVCFDEIYAISPQLAEKYLEIIWLDSVCYNMDRHTENFGFLRDAYSGEIISMAPNYDNNIALISRGYPNSTDREHDGIIGFFRDFVESNPTAKSMLQKMELPEITEEMIDECFTEIPIEADYDFVKAFILNGQSVVRKIISEEPSENEMVEESFGLTL